MPGDRPARARVAVEVERIRQGESSEVPHRVSGARAGFPIADPGDLVAPQQQVAKPEVTVHGCAGRALSPKSLLDGDKPVHHWWKSILGAEALEENVSRVIV